MRNAALMIYPSAHEGFGLVPFEAAEAGVACAFAAQTSTAELLPSRLALIEQWDEHESARRIAPYLDSGPLRAEHIAAVRAAAAPLSWKQTARRLLDVYEQAARAPARESRKLVNAVVAERVEHNASRAELAQAEQRFRELERDYLELRQVFDATAEGLVGANGVIPADLRRPLLAIGTRRALRAPLFGLLRFFYRTGYRLRHRGRAPST